MGRARLTVRSDGRYRCKYKNKYFYGATQKEAYEKRDAYRRMIEAGLKAEADGLTVQAYAKKWVQVYKSHVSDQTYNTHVRILNRFCAHKDIGLRAIRDIDTIDIQDFYNQAQGKSHSYICDMRDTIRGLFRYALADRVTIYDPTVKARLPVGKRGSHRAITQHERELITQTQHRMRPMVMVMLYAGLRRGEALAIDIDRDVDFEAKTITVRGAIRFEGQHLPKEAPPKTAAGYRTIPLLDVLADELRGKHGTLATSASGKAMSFSAFSRAWESYLAALSEMHNGDSKRWYGKRKQDAGKELPPWEDISIRPHDLRHSYCTMLYDAGVDIKTAQKWMGHSDPSVTMKIYTHLSAERENSATESLENLAKTMFGGRNGGQKQVGDSAGIDGQ